MQDASVYASRREELKRRYLDTGAPETEPAGTARGYRVGFAQMSTRFQTRFASVWSSFRHGASTRVDGLSGGVGPQVGSGGGAGYPSDIPADF